VKRHFCLALALASMTLIGARDPILVPDISQRKVEIVYSFTGTELLLFGAILWPGGRVPTDRADIAVVVKGPPESVLLREKRRVIGIWVNADSTDFRSVPGYYAVAASRSLSKLVDERTAAIYELGVGNVQLSPVGTEAPDVQARFEKGLVALRQKDHLFAETDGTVQITDGVLYQARIPIPARVPEGQFTAETFLIKDGRVLAAATKDIDIRKSGFERLIADWAVESPLSYGIIAISISALLGWGAGALFRRNG
jgi:uncharacterized protein (TIGR02186 family)